MKPIKTVISAIFILMSVLSAQAQYTKYSTVRIYPPKNNAKLSEMLSSLDVDHYYENGGGIIVEIGQYEIQKLRLSGFKYDIVVDDVKASVEKQNKKFFADRAAGKVAIEETNNTINNIITTPSSFVVQSTFGGYYSFAQMVAAMDALVTAYPSIVSKTSLGVSHEGRNIWCIKISDNVATDDAAEPDLLYMGLQHAREAVTGASMIFFMQYLAEQYASNSKVSALVNNREIYIIPCLNPDGWEFNRTTATGTVNAIGGGQRKNRRNVGTDVQGTGTTYYAGSQKGVDLNRNWGVDWGNCSAPILGSPTSCGSTSASAGTYIGPGPTAFTEPEIVAVKNLVTAAGKNFVVGFDQHAFGPYYSLPYGRRSLHPALPLVDQQYLYNTSAIMGQYNGMRANDSYGALGYEVAGGFKDWMLLGDIGTGSKGKVYGITGEGGAGGGTPSLTNGSFWPPAAQIINLCKGMCYQNLQLAYSAGSYVDIQDVSDIALSSLSGNLGFTIRRIGLANAPVTVTMVPLQNISSVGAPVTVSSLPNYYDTYTGNISYTLPGALANGQRIRFAWKVETGGYTYYDTVVKFYNPAQLLYDNMEGTLTTNWTNNNEGTVASGFGYNYTGADWVFTTSGGFGGSAKALSESAAGTNYTAQSIRIVQYNGTFNLTGTTAAYLSFWTRHRAENFRDKLRVEVSTNGTTWVAIAGSTTVKEPGTLDAATINGLPSLTGIRENWTREIFDLSAYNGTAALRLRFNFTSDNDVSTFEGELDDGFYIDELKVISTTTPLITLGANFLSFDGKLLKDNTVELKWDAVVDQKHRYFEVEKSSDRQNFTAIGRIEGTDPYKLIDRDPFAGNNYYRIKEVDADGKEMYSKIINVVYNPSLLSVSLYPNPVINELNFKIKFNYPEKVTVQVSDLSGRVISTLQVNVNTIEREYQINTAKLSPQVYVLKIINSKNEVLAVQKFMKQ